jgi:DNA repair exonuclease SbcCD ATPase subunit
VIIFKKLTFKNFLSVGNQPVSINLNETKTTLVHGTNGSGKSTVLDALCYSLFNKPFRRVNLPQLLNSQNKKGLLTEVEFTVGSNEFLVRRGQRPKVFEIYKNGEQIDNKAADKDTQTLLEQNILKLSYKSFTQVVILGSSNFVPFMQLPTVGRRECIEDFLDIKVFSTMSIMAKERLRGLKERLTQIKGEIGNIDYKIDLQGERVKELEQQSDNNIKDLEGKISNARTFSAELSEELTDLIQEEEDLLSQINALMSSQPDKKQSEFNKIVIKLDNKIERLNKNILFYESNDSCHTCNQTLLEETKEKYITESQKDVDQFSSAVEVSTQKMKELQKVLDSVSVLQTKLNETQRESFQRSTRLKSYSHEIRDWQNQITEIEMSSGSIDVERGKYEAMVSDRDTRQAEYVSLLGSVEEHDVVSSLLKDSGIKTQIVKKYLPAMNKFIRHYLTELDLPIHFVLDEEFNESVSSPLHQNFSYASFSEGQKGRIDLALLFTWREIGKLKNSVTTNLLILDEVFSSSLDEAGKENLLTLLRYRLDDSQRILVVDHTLSGNFKEKFDRTIEVTRKSGFSSYN